MSVTANQVTIAALAFDKAMEGVEQNTANKMLAMQAALEAVDASRELVAYAEQFGRYWHAHDVKSTTAEYFEKHRPERIGVDILPVYKARQK